MALLLEETPNYKIQQGPFSLANVELLSLIIATASPEKANEKARMVLSKSNIRDLGKLSAADLKRIGLTEQEANRVVACYEIARRKQSSPDTKKPKVSSSLDAFNIVGHLIADLEIEEFWVAFLNKANEVTGKKKVSVGGTAGTVVDPKIIFGLAIEAKAAGIIVYHNHPSGNLQPSDADISTTRKLKEGGALLEILVLDHLIISERGYYSFADEGML
jgi:DNA repair protein RadC